MNFSVESGNSFSTSMTSAASSVPLGCMIGSFCIIFSLYVTFIVYLGIYGFSNPDSDAWVGHLSVPDNSKTFRMELYPTEEAMKGANATNNVHMHGRLVAWFTWGFWNCMTPIILAICLHFTAKVLPAVSEICRVGVMLGTCCSSVGWFITGIMWRWSSDAQFAVGTLVPSGKSAEEWKTITTADKSLYQVKSGDFMYYYYLIVLLAIPSLCYCACCVGAIWAIKNFDKD